MKLSKLLSYSAIILAIGIIPVLVLLELSVPVTLNWSIVTTLILLLCIFAFYFRFERQTTNSKDLAIVATMAALAGAGRIPFAIIPSLQPTTFLVIITGYVFGVQAGFMVGATSAVVSNFFLGQGPWTPWQMIAWGLAGASAGLLGKLKVTGRWKLSLFATIWGFTFGWLMNIYTWTTYVYPLDWTSFWATQLTSFPMDVIHAAGNFMFMFSLGPDFIKILQRFKRKMVVEFMEIEFPKNYVEERSR